MPNCIRCVSAIAPEEKGRLTDAGWLCELCAWTLPRCALLELRTIKGSPAQFYVELAMALKQGWVYGMFGKEPQESTDWRGDPWRILTLERWRGFPGVPTRIFHNGWSELASAPTEE